MALVESPSDALVALVGGLSTVHMDEYAVVGSYMRFGEQVREQLKDARVRIAEAASRPRALLPAFAQALDKSAANRWRRWEPR
ncbi:MAG TPA: hypothetical protein VFU99_07830 [Gaiellaceae bacterium]|nr:hypothetical protein [Gaiellaceae bacterium]